MFKEVGVCLLRPGHNLMVVTPPEQGYAMFRAEVDNKALGSEWGH